VDHLAPQRDENWPARRAAGPSMVEPLHQRVSETIATRSAWVRAAHERSLDLLHDPSPHDEKSVGTLISKITLETLGVGVSPHLFRTAAASTAAAYGGNTPHLASALLNHTDPRVTEEHYNRASTVSAAAAYARIISGFRDGRTS
jgi:integrase